MKKQNTPDCKEQLLQKFPELTPRIPDQMDYYLTGKECGNNKDCEKAVKEYNEYNECKKVNKVIEFDTTYLNVVQELIDTGTWKMNERTGKNCLFMHGGMMKFDLSTGYFPLLTTKKMAVKSMIGELIGFLRGVDNAKDFRDLKCKFWDANANESEHWLNNPNRKGTDDLGRIYGVQARDWKTNDGKSIDQLGIVVDKLSKGIDDRRLIVTHWNVGELDKMALPPCHMTYTFGIRDGYLDMCMYQRSCDLPLGIPMNVASYALLLELIAKITGLKAGVFTHFMWNVHIYEDQFETIKEQLLRTPFNAPKLKINCDINNLEDIETTLEVDDIVFEDYECHPPLLFPFAK